MSSTNDQNHPAPTSRPSISDNQQQGPIPLFDFQLRVITESYLNFFQERIRVEEYYVDSLTRLQRRAKAIDSLLDGRSETSTTRSAWNEVRDNVEREALARQAFLTTLTVDVVNPLISFRDAQDRSRKRMKEDLKQASIEYDEYAENMLPKLKRMYLKKCQDVEDHKAASAGPSMQMQSPQPSQPPTPGAEYATNPLANTKSYPNSAPQRPPVAGPQPLRPLDRRPSGSAPVTRQRSPSGSNSIAFLDIAQQGSKKLNQLRTFLDKGASVKDSLGRGDGHGLKAVRSKREADEADKEYRKGVHWLETLRLRRMKLLEGAYISLEMFINESATTVKRILEKYTDNMIATTTTQTQLSHQLRGVVNKISPEKDTLKVASQIPRSLASAIPKPTYYYNYAVGESSDLIFGVSLVDYATARGLPDGQVPKIIRICIKEVDQRGLNSEGIYRVSGRHAHVQELQHKIERNERAFELNPLTDDVYVVSSLLKLYLRTLPEPLFKYPLQDRIQHTEEISEHQSNNFMLLRAKIRRLPPVHQATLKALLEHLSRIISNTEKNKMDAKNLAIVFGSVIFGEDEMPKAGDLLSVQSWKDTLMEDLITNATILFDEKTSNHYSPTQKAATASLPPNQRPASIAPPPYAEDVERSPPLPPAPAGEPVPVYPYGSSHTRVSNMPGPVPLSPTNAEDFTPRLPPRPGGSIHPSHRANPVSPTKSQFDIEAPPPLSPRLSIRHPIDNLPAMSAIATEKPPRDERVAFPSQENYNPTESRYTEAPGGAEPVQSTLNRTPRVTAALLPDTTSDSPRKPSS